MSRQPNWDDISDLYKDCEFVSDVYEYGDRYTRVMKEGENSFFLFTKVRGIKNIYHGYFEDLEEAINSAKLGGRDLIKKKDLLEALTPRMWYSIETVDVLTGMKGIRELLFNLKLYPLLFELSDTDGGLAVRLKQS